MNFFRNCLKILVSLECRNWLKILVSFPKVVRPWVAAIFIVDNLNEMTMMNMIIQPMMMMIMIIQPEWDDNDDPDHTKYCLQLVASTKKIFRCFWNTQLSKEKCTMAFSSSIFHSSSRGQTPQNVTRKNLYSTVFRLNGFSQYGNLRSDSTQRSSSSRKTKTRISCFQIILNLSLAG